ncbi:hypothetical protein [Alkaliphilus metalliredigens]|nr:hypothetical protein [Alkaliphilus metalliredigens]
MNLTVTTATYISFFILGFDLLMKLVAIYVMYIAIKALKVYIKKNS